MTPSAILVIAFAVCDYSVHVECQDFGVADCKECATYVPSRDAVSSFILFLLILLKKMDTSERIKIFIFKLMVLF